ncbi:MAG: hypothetical protein SGI84_07680 [Gemmatimonadota bacterium]|nr:hypothetical protein [Gemmatimonadota bacterium]
MKGLRASWALAVMTLVGGAGVANAQAEPRRQARDRDVITRAELVESAQKNQDLLKAVKSLRAHFLRPPPGVRSMTGPPPNAIQLYVDGIRQAEVESLILIPTIDAEEVRYLEPGKAQDMYGITHNGGAILVKKYRGPPPTPP